MSRVLKLVPTVAGNPPTHHSQVTATSLQPRDEHQDLGNCNQTAELLKFLPVHFFMLLVSHILQHQMIK
jgi:hypothetical protein